MDQSTKKCKPCGEVKALELFSRHPHVKDGRSTSCKSCDSARLKARAAEIRATPKNIPSEKFCKKCESTKPASRFGRRQSHVDGLNYYCKSCVNSATATRQANNPELLERMRERNRAVYADQEKYLNYRYRGQFGISLQDYRDILESQGGGCAICGVEPTPGAPRHPVDHDHSCCPGKKSCGKCVRGILCASCNQGLGKFRDRQEFLQRAISYLAA